MDEKEKICITVNDKILLHLKDYIGYRNEKEVPREITQKGIADAVGILPSHVPRALKKLISDGFVSERDGYITGGTRKSRVYVLTEDGASVAKKLAEKVCMIQVDVKKNGAFRKTALSDVNLIMKRKQSLLSLYNLYSTQRCIDIDRIESGMDIVDFTSRAPKIPVFYNREKDMQHLEKIIATRKMAVVFGVRGIGKTALISRFVERFRGRKSLFWYQLDLSDRLENIVESLSEFLNLMGTKTLSDVLTGDGRISPQACVKILQESLSGTETLMVFDGYNEPAEDVVEFFYLLVQMLNGCEGVKVLISAREDIPFYNWFYSRKEIENGTVGELRLKGIDRESGKKILNQSHIDEDAYKQIYQLTKGVPLLLEYVRDGNSEALKMSGLFTAQEIRLMMGLKCVKNNE